MPATPALLPAPAALPVASKHWLWGCLREFQGDSLGAIAWIMRDFGDAARVRFLYLHYYFFNHPDAVKHILQERPSNYVKSPNFQKLRVFLGEGLLLSEGEFWRRQRRIAQPGFHRQRLAGIADRLAAAADQAVERLRPAAGGERSVDVSQETMRFALEAVSTGLFSNQIGAADAARIAAALTVAQHDAEVRTESVIDWPMVVPTPLNRAARRARKDLDAIVFGMIEARRREGDKPDDLLTMLVEARDGDTGQGMSDGELRDEVATMLLAGHETTANALAWTLYLLAGHPAVEATLRAELDGVLGGRAPMLSDLRSLPYTQMVLDEAMRLYPPAWITERRALAADVIAGHPIPAGALIFLSPWAMHRNPAFWPDPERFDPERFSAASSAGRPRYAYFPFGGGPRQCIGKDFALMELQLALPRLVQAFRFERDTTRPVTLLPQITLRPATGIWLKLRPA